MNLELVEQIVSLIDTHALTEITVEDDGRRFHVRRPLFGQPPPYADTANAAAIETLESASIAEPANPPIEAEDNPIVLTSPMVGLFHHRQQPIPYGGLITPGQVVGSIESMKLMSDVLADQGGRVVEVLIEDGAPVEYGQPLFRLAPA